MAWTFESDRKELAGPAVILLAAAIAVAPLVLRGPSCGSDLYFHLASWFEAQQSMLLGLPYPHWAPNSNFGAGEPRFVFYPPLSWMAGAVLGLFLPWRFVAVAFSFLLLAAIGLANRALAREVLTDGPATLAGCTAIFFGYALLTIYIRSDFAELVGSFWIPLLILYLLRDRSPSGGLWRQAFDGSTVPLAVVLAGAWLSNGPVGLMASYLLAALAITAALAGKSWAPVMRATVGAALGLGLAADYLVPAAWEQRWANLQYAISISHYWVENSWLFARHTNPALLAYSHDQKLLAASWVATGMLATALGAAVVAWMRGALPGARRYWIPLVLIPFAVLFLMLPVSLPVWNSLPKLRYLQFPWRWLVVLEAPMAVFFASAVWFVPLRKRIPAVAACAILFVAISGAAGRYWFGDCGDDLDSVLAAEQYGWGVHGKFEYAPAGVRYAPIEFRPHDACLVKDPPKVLGQDKAGANPEWSGSLATCRPFRAYMYLPEHKRIVGTADCAGYLILRLRSYPAWQVTVNGRPVSTVVEREYGLMAVPVSQGPVNVIVDWTTTPDVVAGRWLSVLSVLLLTVLWSIERKLSRSRL